MYPASSLWSYRDRALSLLILLFSGFISSCEKDPEPLISNSCITGYVSVANAALGEYPQLKVTASGPYGSMTTISDNNGVFWFKNVGNGTYDLQCSLYGYGTVKTYGVQVFGNDTAQAHFSELAEMPDTDLELPEFENAFYVEDLSQIHINTNGTDCNNNISVRFFLGTSNEVSDINYRYSSVANLDQSCQLEIPVYLSNYFGGGDLVYIVGYICSPNDNGYVDFYKGIAVFPTINKKSRSRVLSFNLPQVFK